MLREIRRNCTHTHTKTYFCWQNSVFFKISLKSDFHNWRYRQHCQSHRSRAKIFCKYSTTISPILMFKINSLDKRRCWHDASTQGLRRKLMYCHIQTNRSTLVINCNCAETSSLYFTLLLKATAVRLYECRDIIRKSILDQTCLFLCSESKKKIG